MEADILRLTFHSGLACSLENNSDWMLKLGEAREADILI